MSDIIQLLPDAIANQIAAGEVVQRPSSALKELLENAVDAGATQVQVIVKDAGKQLIQVVDNGKGMSATDARMSFERHATSKIRQSKDLFSIRTFGFRGEALASIAAVAQVELKTQQADSELGTLIQIEGSEVKKQEPCAGNPGTSVSMKNLFYNVPARRNFLKSNPVEMKHIVEEFQRVALSYPEISFSLYQQDLEVYSLTSGKLSQRIVGLFGKNYKGNLVACEELTPHINVKGYIGKPESAKKTRGEQFFFVNNRYIKSNYLHHAVSSAYEGLIQTDQHPFYVLFLDIDPSHIDINVHPTKTEIKFDDERTIYSVIRSAVKQALGAHHVVPALDFSFDVNFSEKWDKDPEKKAQIDREYSYKSFNTPEFKKTDASGWERLFENDQQKNNMPDTRDSQQESEVLTFSSRANPEESLPAIPKPAEEEQAGTTFQVELNYVVAQMSTGMLIIDQQTAHERILYERYLRQLKLAQGTSQQCLFPPTVQLGSADFALVMDILPELHNLGFQVSEFGKDTIIIQGVPADIQVKNEKELFEGLLEQFKNFKNELSLDTRENLARSLARKSSLKRGQKLNSQEMETLVGQLFACQNPNYGLGGNKTFVKLDLSSIQSFFGKSHV
ncbi:DNA mismatch repair endonuclease MutL [Algoriphagus halophytocola]|uniref:DNA mismatch repair protein MutL n=1 Tax=Algoriphagus halophytocola TaxID=2991499 RepID=A0ABY6MG44_9BACT|nr:MULTISPECIES: DNA mismatch repair endonuclease MutL [unclassified Algoriphagus]UZD21296.1 DNA mismatch repair endonuclease MutL [Algoriphagus sp. TR-M5]WBL42507.1 DNA mismatch repair endonuclease MutL [Algoriphagus sp. TR-M9]